MRIMAFLIFLFVIYLYACFNTSTWLHCSLLSVLRFSDYTIFNYSVAKFERVRQYCVWMINWQFIDLPPLFHLFINMHNISPNKKNITCRQLKSLAYKIIETLPKTQQCVLITGCLLYSRLCEVEYINAKYQLVV